MEILTSLMIPAISDIVDFGPPCCGFTVNVAGNARIIFSDGTDSGTIAWPAGFYPLSIRRIYSTGMSATIRVYYKPRSIVR